MKHICVVEPDIQLARAYKTVLLSDRATVQTFTTPAQAITAFETTMPDVVVLELAIPAHNGLELLYEMHSYSDTRHIAVVVYSIVKFEDIPWGFVSPEDLGITRYLNKTTDSLLDLKEAVYEIL